MKEINKEIEKTFTEMDSVMAVLWQEAENHTNDWKQNPNHQTKKDIETRLNHLFDNSQPALNEERKLSYSFYELKEMLTKIIDGLPGLIDGKGEMNQKLLTSLVSISEALEKLKNGEEKQITIPGELGDGNFYELVKKSESDEIRKKLIFFEETEEDKKKQLKQLEEKEQQMRNEIKTELTSIDRSAVYPRELSAEELNNSLVRLREMKKWLTDGTEEQKKIIEEEHEDLKKLLGRLKLEEQRRRVEKRITDALADKVEVVLEKRVEVEKGELPDYKDKLQKEGYRNYSQTLDEMDSLVKIGDFEREILQVIAEQRQAYKLIIYTLSLGEKAIENKNIRKAKKAKECLVTQCDLLRKSGSDGYRIYLKKANDFYVMIGKLESFIIEQEQTIAQITQPTK